MGNKYISSSLPGGYSVNTNVYTGFNINPGVSVGTGGFYASYYGIILNQISATPSNSFNLGVINGREGVIFEAAGTFTNEGTVGSGGVSTNRYAATIINEGYINGGVFLSSFGGVVYNGTALKPSGLIEGGVTAYGGRVVNFATLHATYGAAATLSGATLTNGSGVDGAAVVAGLTGVYLKAGGSVVNFATIDGDGAVVAYDGPSSGYGVWASAGGSVTNGQANDHRALIEGYTGVGGAGAAATVTNFGEIDGLNPSGGAGVQLQAGGVVTNGAPTDTSATIQGYFGVELYVSGTVHNYGIIRATGVAAPAVSTPMGQVVNGSFGDESALISGALGVVMVARGTVTNYGRIEGLADQGVLLGGGSRVVNGFGADRTATITGLVGVEITGTAGTVINNGTIIGEATSSGVWLTKGGSVANGSATNATALIEGYTGLLVAGAGTSTNFGTIAGLGGAGTEGADLSAGQLTNGAAGHGGAVIEGYAGVLASGAATVVNYGVIDGLGGTAVDFTSASDVLEVGAGSSFIGAIAGGGGVLELGAGAWSHAGLLSSTGAITLAGPIAATTFGGFGALEVGAGASLTVTGNGSVTAGQGLIVAGTLTTAGTITSAGTLTVSGALGGTGTLALSGGTATFATGAALTLAKVTQSGGTASFTAASTTIAVPWTQTAGTVTVATGDKVLFTGAGDVFDGTLAGAGTVDFTAGSDTLSGTQVTATSVVVTGASVTLSGVIGLSHTVLVTSPNLTIAAAGATITGAGALELTSNASNAIHGGALTNNGKVEGAGLISVSALGNAGMIEANLGTGLTLTSGSGTVSNSGVIENASTGGLTITSAVANGGTLMVSKGTLTADGSVSGIGKIEIEGGTADLAGAFSGAVAFTTAGGVLALAHSRTDTVTVTGFAKTPITKLDLQDINFTGATVSYSGTTTSGVLTVKNGTAVAKVTLDGNYTTSTFTLADDGAGHVLVTDPTTQTRPPVTAQPLVAAMAGFGGGSGGAAAAHHPPPERLGLSLATPSAVS